MPFSQMDFRSLTPESRQLRVRREAAKLGFRALRSRYLRGTPQNLGGWQILGPRGKVLAGAKFELNDEGAYSWLVAWGTPADQK